MTQPPPRFPRPDPLFPYTTLFRSIAGRCRYNQAFRSIDAMVPALFAMLLMLIPAILTALGVVSERERGSIINFYVTPVRKLEFLLGKQLPYVALAGVNLLLLIGLAIVVFGVPLKGSIVGLLAGGLLYVFRSTEIGRASCRERVCQYV